MGQYANPEHDDMHDEYEFFRRKEASEKSCEFCRGTGRIQDIRCLSCNGSGKSY